MGIWKFPYYDTQTGVDWKGLENYSWFTDMKGVPQDKIWHAEGDVQVHTKLVCEELISLPEFTALTEEEKHILLTSALMHDIEKRSTTVEVEIDGKIRIKAPRHAQRGEFTSREILYKSFPDIPFTVREEICKLVRYHGMPLWKEEKLEKEVIMASLCLNVSHLAMLSKADVLGRDCGDKTELLEKIEYFKLVAKDLNSFDRPYIFSSGAHRNKYLTSDNDLSYVPFDDSKFEVTMVCGIAGSGKDTYIKKNFNSLPMISLDEIREELKIKPTDKKGNGRVYQEAKERCKVLMRKKESFVFNATNIVTDTRSKWTSLFEAYKGKVSIHYIEVPFLTLLKQNNNREDKVPEKIIHKMISKLEVPSYDEAVSVKYICK